MEPLVSIMILTMNSRDHIDESIQSLLNQTYDNIELIIVDGGSTDGTLEYCESIKDNRVKILSGGDRVPSRNLAIKEANGKYIAIADSDTVSSPDRIQRQIDFLEANPDYGVVGSHTVRVEESGGQYVDRKPTDHTTIKEQSVFQFPMVHSSMTFRKSVFDEVGGYRFYQWEDYELLTRVLAKGFKAKNFDEVMVSCHMREEGVTGSTSKIEMGLSSLMCRILAIYRYDFSVVTKILLTLRTIADLATRTIRSASIL